MGVVKEEIINVLKKYERVLIDTNSFIYFMEDNEAYADILQIVFDTTPHLGNCDLEIIVKGIPDQGNPL